MMNMHLLSLFGDKRDCVFGAVSAAHFLCANLTPIIKESDCSKMNSFTAVAFFKKNKGVYTPLNYFLFKC